MRDSNRAAANGPRVRRGTSANERECPAVASPDHPDSQAFASLGQCERREPVPPRALERVRKRLPMRSPHEAATVAAFVLLWQHDLAARGTLPTA